MSSRWPGAVAYVDDQALIAPSVRVADITQADDGVAGADALAPSRQQVPVHLLDAPERAAPDEQDRAVGQVQVGPDGWSPRAGTPRCRGCRRPKRGTLTRCGPRSSPGATLGSRSSGRGTPALLFVDARHRNGVSGRPTRALTPGRQQGTPLVRDGVLFMPNPRDVIQAIDAVTGDLIWEYRRDRPDDLGDYMIGSLIDTNRNIAIHGELIIDTTMDDHIIALHAETGEVVWDTEILDYKVNPANQTSGPIVANGKAYSGRSCDPRGGPLGCVITAHDAATGEELWRRRLIPAVRAIWSRGRACARASTRVRASAARPGSVTRLPG